MAIVADADDFPLTGSLNPKIGKFEFDSYHDPAVTEVVHMVDLDEKEWGVGGEVFIACHAVVITKEGDGWREETAWGCYDKSGEPAFNSYEWEGKRWGCYFDYTIQPPGEPGKGVIDIPLEVIQVKFHFHMIGKGQVDSYFDVELQGVPEGYDIINTVGDQGWYDGWCADSDMGIEAMNTFIDAKLYLSTDVDSLPAYAKDDEIYWDQINYVLNKYHVGEGIYASADYRDIQVVIWYLTDATPVLTDPDIAGYDAALVDDILDDAALNGVGFYPSPGEWLAVIVDTDFAPTQTHQLTFIVVDP
jgi:hypothetical protein